MIREEEFYLFKKRMDTSILINDKIINCRWKIPSVFDEKTDQLNGVIGSSTTEMNLEDFSGTLSIKGYFNNGKDLFLVYRTSLS